MSWNHRLIIVLAVVLCSCGETEQSTEQLQKVAVDNKAGVSQKISSARPAAGYLSDEYANLRKNQVDKVQYKLSVTLPREEPEFSGRVEIDFDLKTNDRPLTVDFSEGTVMNITLNGLPVEVNYNGWFITLDTSSLSIGEQKLTIDFSHAYSTTGSGLYRFTDPEDGRVYVYTDFEPYDANRLFPLFDQPNLKATYQLQAEVPKDWLVVSSTRESEVQDRGETQVWVFPESHKFSSYIFSLHAGPYHVWEDRSGNIPLRLMARQALAKHIDDQVWFDTTKQGFEFFQQYFDIPYPFIKYDQLIVPDFNAGAMENVAAVTFSERFVRRGSYTREENERIANVILHEMAHMWFGNLVTMGWWNGLWLNESFATYMAHLAQVENTPYTQGWHSFYSRSKTWGYVTDEQVTNHPIELPVDNTDSGFANFDGITYGKGAAVLKQLSHLLGEEKFRQGVSRYLKAKSYENSELVDFIDALANAADKDLNQWTQQWLYKKGTNQLNAEYQCDDDRLLGLQLNQSAPESSPVLREHRLQVALFNQSNNDDMKLSAVIPATISGRKTVITDLDGLACPDLVYPNYEDWGFIKIELAEQEWKVLRRAINRFDDTLLRSMLWRNLWEGVRDARLPLDEYLNIVLSNLAEESNIKILSQVLRTIPASLKYFHYFDDKGVQAAKNYALDFENLLWQQIVKNRGNIDLQKMWFDYYVAIVYSDEALVKLAALLKGSESIEGLELDQDRRWRLLRKLSARDHGDVDVLLTQELENDPSSNGEKAKISVQAARPYIDNKKQWLQEIQNKESTLSLAKLRAAMGSLLSAYYPEITQELFSQVLEPLPSLDSSREQQYLRHYTRALLNGYCQIKSNEKLQQSIDLNQSSSLGVTKALKIALQEDQRCLRIKDLYMQ